VPSNGTNDQEAAMSTSVVVTGASSGLGLVAATRLAESGHHVVLACRDTARGEAAAREIRRHAPDAGLDVLEMDLASLASVRAAARKLTGTGDRPPLHGLICNAGIQVVSGVMRSGDGYELTFATNHLGHFLLTELLIDHIAAPGRVVVVSSGTHYGPPRSGPFPAPRWQDPRALADPDASTLDDSPRSGRIRYSTSKLANLYMTYELARRVGDRGITANAFDPGLMPETRLHRDYPAGVQRLYDRIAPLAARVIPGARLMADSGADLAWLATDPAVAEVTGGYFAGRRRRRSSAVSYDQARAAELWKVSAELVAAPARS
jgi:light-dependent protochlorophyllide reductase